MKSNPSTLSLNKLSIVIISLLLSFICITINSKNSFLYAFQDSSDIHCFFTVARCMNNGGILYKDIFEAKGLYLFWMYCIAHLISNSSYIGIYIFELLLFSLFIYTVFYTTRLYCGNDIINITFACFVGIVSSHCSDFFGGGQCEELCLAPVAISIYYTIKIMRLMNTSKTPNRLYSLVIGICFGLVFWMKYTLTGIFIGIVLAVIVVGIKENNKSSIFSIAIWFSVGATITTIPVILYFGINNALYDLWDTYFYTLIFKYSNTNVSSDSFLSKLFSVITWWIAGIAAMIVFMNKKIIIGAERIALSLMLIMAIWGVASSNIWMYSKEILYAFAVYYFIGFVSLSKTYYDVELHPKIYHKITPWIEKWRTEWDEKYSKLIKKTAVKAVLILFALVYVTFLVWLPSPERLFMKYSIEDYPQYQMSKIILDSKGSDAKILHIDMLDIGEYFLTDTIPPSRIFSTHNHLFSLNELGWYEKYIRNNEVDFIVTNSKKQLLEDNGYVVVFDESTNYVIDSLYQRFVLYERSNLVQ